MEANLAHSSQIDPTIARSREEAAIRNRTTRTAILYRSDEPLHLGSVLMMTAPLNWLATARAERTILFLDFGHHGPRRPVSDLTEACLDRLACHPTDAVPRVGLATAVPSIARLTTVVASMLPAATSSSLVADPRVWFREVLLAAGLLATRATHAVVEAGGPSDLALARKLASKINQLLPDACPFPSPLLSGYQPFLSLAGTGPMGTSQRGTIYINDPADVVAKKIRSARTDTRPAFDPTETISPEVRNLLLLQHALTGETTSTLVDRLAGRGYAFLKNELTDAVNAFLDPIRDRRQRLVRDEPELRRAIALESLSIDRAAGQMADALTRSPGVLAA